MQGRYNSFDVLEVELLERLKARGCSPPSAGTVQWTGSSKDTGEISSSDEAVSKASTCDSWWIPFDPCFRAGAKGSVGTDGIPLRPGLHHLLFPVHAGRLAWKIRRQCPCRFHPWPYHPICLYHADWRGCFNAAKEKDDQKLNHPTGSHDTGHGSHHRTIGSR